MTDDQDNQDSYFKEVLDGQQRADEKARQQAIERDQIEREQQRRTDQQRRLAVEEMREIAQTAWQQSTNGQELQAALLDKDVVLSKGVDDEIVLIDGGHKIHSLERAAMIAPKGIENRIQDLDKAALPDFEQAKSILADRLQNITLPDPMPDKSKARSAQRIAPDQSHELDKPQLINTPRTGVGLGESRTFKSEPRKTKKTAPEKSDRDTPDTQEPSQNAPAFSELEPPPHDYDSRESVLPDTPPLPEKSYVEKRNERWQQLAKDHNTRKDMLEAYADYREQRDNPPADPKIAAEEKNRRAEIDKQTAKQFEQLGDKSPTLPADPQPKPSMLNRIKSRIMGKPSREKPPQQTLLDQPKIAEKSPDKAAPQKYKIIDLDDPDLEKDWEVKPRDRSGDRGDDFTR